MVTASSSLLGSSREGARRAGDGRRTPSGEVGGELLELAEAPASVSVLHDGGRRLQEEDFPD